MTTKESVESIIVEYQSKKLWGSIELEFNAGKIVFIRKKETIVPCENNSVGARGANGTHDRDLSTIQYS